MKIRAGTEADLESIAALIALFAKGHPAENQPRPIEVLREAYLGVEAIAHIVVAEKPVAGVIGFAAWRRDFDMFWSMWGGEGVGMFVAPSYRGLGVALSLVTAMCSQIREQGGQYIRASYEGDHLAKLYERVAIGRPERACFISSTAFDRLADMAGRPPRMVVAHLPDRKLNFSARPPPEDA
jgi:GNAT superfamily N-acetyltransferase